MAQEIGRGFSFGAETHAAARGRESQVEEAGCRSEPRQGHAAGCAGKKELTLARLREWVRDQQARYGASERQVCFALRVSRSSFRYCSVAADDSALRLRIREITETRVHYGYRRVHVMLRREDLRDNHKRIYRLYSEQGLYPNHVWGMDFVSDALFDGLRLRLLTVIDLYTRECLGNCVGQNLHSTEVAEMLNTIALRRPLPQLLKTDNGSEFAGKMLGKWVYERELVHVSGGCTVQNRGLAHTL